MFQNYKEQMKKVPSWQYKNSLLSSSMAFGVCIILFVSVSIYFFIKFADLTVWWIGFIPLAIAIIMIPINVLVIKFLLKNYKLAIEREKQELSLKEENEALKREIEELKRK